MNNLQLAKWYTKVEIVKFNSPTYRFPRKLSSKFASKKLFTKFHSTELDVGFHDQQRKKKLFIQVKHISI